MKRLLLVALALIFALPCIASGETAMGRWVESDMGLPGGLESAYSMRLNESGEIELYAVRDAAIVKCVRGADGSWREETPSWTAAMPDIGLLVNFTASGDEVWALKYGDESTGYRPRVGRVQGGVMAEVPLEDMDMFAEEIALAENGLIVLRTYDDGLRVFDPETGRERYSLDQYDGGFILRRNLITALSYKDQSAVQFDLTTGETVFEIEGAPITDNDKLYADEQSIYVSNPGGVYRAARGGGLWERMVDGALTSLRTPSLSILAMTIVEGEPVLLLSNYAEKSMRLVRYTYDQTVPTLPENQLRVYTLSESNMLEQAASAFQASHPDYLVDITVLLQDDTAATSSDVIRALNAELLAGEGPDVMLLDGMPLDSYVEKGVLADLGPVANPMLEKGELLNSVVNAMKSDDGAIYALPTSFSLPVIIGKAGAQNPATLEELAAFSQNGGESRALGKRSLSGYYSMLLPGSFPAWISEGGELNEDIFAQYLQGLVSIHGAIGVNEDPYESQIKEAIVTFSGKVDAMGMMGGYAFEILDLKSGGTALFPMMLDSLTAKMIELTALGEIEGTLDFLPGQARGVFMPTEMLGVNARSAHAEAALDFVRTALTPQVQDMNFFAGLPVNRITFEKLVARKDGYALFSMNITDPETGGMVELKGSWPPRWVLERVYELAKQAGTPYIPDEELLNMISTQLKPFFEGSMDAGEAARVVAAKARAYLAE